MELLLGFFGIGQTEVLIIGAIVLLLFGSTRLPSLMRNIGRSAVEFKKGMNDIGDDLDPVDSDKPKSADS